MRKTLMRCVIIFGCYVFLCVKLNAQAIFTGINNTVFNLPCGQSCTNLNFRVPHLKTDDEYSVVSIPYTPYPYTTPTGNELTTLYADDLYSQAISLPFPICFYGNVYNEVVVGSNGLLTFDIANANCVGAYTISPTIPDSTGIICQLNGVYYPKASIMGVYSDLDPRAVASPIDRKIEWRFEGTAPFRRFIASWNKVGVYGNNACGLATPTTFQIVINESTDAIEVFVEQKICMDASNGKAILGVQDWSRRKAQAASGKNATIWTAIKEGYRFIPSGVSSRFVSSKLFLLNGVSPIATAVTATTVPGLLDIDFGNICVASPSQQYVVKTTYSSCINPLIPIIIEDTITINKLTALDATSAATNTLCGSPSGEIQITVPAGMGTSPYTFTLNTGPGQIIQTAPSPITFSNLAQGTYSVFVTDVTAGCSSNLTNIIVGRTNNLTATTDFTATSCPTANNGTITVTPNTGNSPYSFVLDGVTTQTGTTNTTFLNLSPGLHNIVVTEAFGCVTNPLPVTVTSDPALSTTAIKTDLLCNSGNSGTITVAQPASGTPPFQYSLDNFNWQANNIFTGLSAGTYTVYYKENNNCRGSLTITLTEPTALQSSSTSIPVICNRQNNGVITITANGGVGPYEYSIDAGANWQSNNVFNKAAGIYTVIIRDANGCTRTENITVTEPAVLSATSINSNASCDGGNDGIITVTANGGNTSYQYSIDNGVNWQSTNIFNVAPGAYTIQVKDNLGCTANFNTTVGLSNNLSFTAQADPTICESNSTQLEMISNATQYEWSPRIALNDTTIFNPVANPVVTTQYVVIATLGRCAATDTVLVNVNPAPIPDAGMDGYICFGQTYTLQASGGVKYLWSPSTYLNSTTIPNPVSSATKSITYTLSVIADANGCKSLVTDDIKLDVTPPFKVHTYPFDTIGYPGDQFKLLAVADEPNATIFNWTPTTRLTDAHIYNPDVTVGAIGEDVLYQVIASTIAGCKGEAYVSVKVYKGPEIYVPTGFTPNGDGKNDRFIPFPVGIKSLNYFKVFNRWGQVVFSTNKLHDGWDGRLAGKEQSSGSFIWMIEAITNQGKTITKRGTVTLIR